jgi:hypothetical protein
MSNTDNRATKTHLDELVVWTVRNTIKVLQACNIVQLVEVDDATSWVLLREEDDRMARDETSTTGDQNIRGLLKYKTGHEQRVTFIRQQHTQPCNQSQLGQKYLLLPTRMQRPKP